MESKLIAEGKTKKIFLLGDNEVCVQSKDDITAFNNLKHNLIPNKGAACNRLTAKIFEFLAENGVKNHFIKRAATGGGEASAFDNSSFIAKRLTMIPLEFIARRVATGSFLKRNAGVPEGYKFHPLKIEITLKDDEKGDPIVSEDSIIASSIGNVVIESDGKSKQVNENNEFLVGRKEVQLMKRITEAVFEMLERVWSKMDYMLVDLKVEFGVDGETREILLGDVIDNDSWRLWPHGDKSKMLDKQVYRDAKVVNDEMLNTILRHYENVAESFEKALQHKANPDVAIVMGSASDTEYCKNKILPLLNSCGIGTEMIVCSAHKSTEEALTLLGQLEKSFTAIIAVAGRSNGLGPVMAGNCEIPVINCPPPSSMMEQDMWSSLHVPSGIGCTTVIGGECGALAAAKIVALKDPIVSARLRGRRFKVLDNILRAN